MLKLMSYMAAAALALAGSSAMAQPVLGPDAASCRAGGGPAVLVDISGFKNRNGRVRVQLYGNNPREFLAKGKKLERIDIPVTASGNMRVCVAVPRAGNYAIAVRHDADANGKSGWNDGGGFSRNPRISLMDLKPGLNEVIFAVGNGVTPINVVLNYRRGLSVGPISRL